MPDSDGDEEALGDAVALRLIVEDGEANDDWELDNEGLGEGDGEGVALTVSDNEDDPVALSDLVPVAEPDAVIEGVALGLDDPLCDGVPVVDDVNESVGDCDCEAEPESVWKRVESCRATRGDGMRFLDAPAGETQPQHDPSDVHLRGGESPSRG